MAFSMNDVLWREFLQAEEIDSSPLGAVYRWKIAFHCAPVFIGCGHEYQVEFPVASFHGLAHERIPVQYQFDIKEVEVFQRDGARVLRPKPANAADVFARARAVAGGGFWDFRRPEQGEARPVPSLDV